MFNVEEAWEDGEKGSENAELVMKKGSVKTKLKKLKRKQENEEQLFVGKKQKDENISENKLTRKQWKNKTKNKKKLNNKYKATGKTATSKKNNDENNKIDVEDSSHEVCTNENIKKPVDKSFKTAITKNNHDGTLKSNALAKLKGARFRYLNEQLYTRSSKDAEKLFDSDKEAFVAYHDGYSKQVEHWSVNPLDVIISYVKARPKKWTVADFGCGDARLSRSVKNKVHSFDLVATNDRVTACDMANVPLEDESIDLAVFCLSLMGTNLKDFLCEANRVLRENGFLKIAEVASRFKNVKNFIKYLSKAGFSIINQDTRNDFFYTFDFKKSKNVTKDDLSDPSNPVLKPCLYKKR